MRQPVFYWTGHRGRSRRSVSKRFAGRCGAHRAPDVRRLSGGGWRQFFQRKRTLHGLHAVSASIKTLWNHYRWSKERTLWGVELAVARTEVPACVRIWARVRLAVSTAKSASRMEDSE